MEAEKVGIRELRAKLRTYLSSSEPLVVMKNRVKVAVILTTGLTLYASAAEQRAALARMKKAFRDQVETALFGEGW